MHPQGSQSSPELRLFISSTFVDLAAEREYLVKHIFPEIRSAARERGVEFTEIDLRWGITVQEVEEGKTIKTCLSEVDRCRPYFIGILGSRYGWQPTPNDLTKDAELLEHFPWVEEAVATGMSVTEMEMSYGALNASGGSPNAFFYFRKNTEQTEERVKSLQERIRTSGFPVLEDYSNVEELGARVRTDLLNLIAEQFPAVAEPSPLEIERRANEAYAHTRRRAYVPNPSYLDRLTAFADDTDPEHKPLVVVGKSGGGKSSLLAYWSQEYRKANPDVFVITHYVGAAHSSPASVIRHIMLEIKDRSGSTDPIPEQADELERDLPQWLGKLHDEKIVIAIDAVNQLNDPRGHGLNWLPAFIPSNIRLVLSTTGDVYGKPDEEHTLAHRRWNEFILEALTPEQRHEVTKHYLSQYHKTLTRPQLEALATSEKCASPLFLRTILEELRIFGKYKQIDERIAHYLASSDTDDLFQRVLERMEQDYGESIVQQVMSLIWAARHGLSENELLGVLEHVSRYELSSLLHALDYHLIRNAGLLNFFHAYLRRAVESRYVNAVDAKQSVHRQLANYFQHQPADKRRADEEPYNWQKAEDIEGLQQCLSDVPLLFILLEEERRQEIIGYWKTLREHVNLKDLYQKVTAEFEAEEGDLLREIAFYRSLGDTLSSASEYEIAEELLRKGLAYTIERHGEHSFENADAKTDLGLLLYHRSDFEEAQTILKEAAHVKCTIPGKEISYAMTLNNLGTVYYAIAKYTEAEDAFNRVLTIYQTHFTGPRREIAEVLGNLATLLFLKQRYSEAKKYYLEAYSILNKLYGSVHLSLIPCITNLAMVEEQLGDLVLSESYRKEVIQLSELIHGKQSVEMCLALGNIGVFYSRIGRYDEAIELLTTAQGLRLKVLGDNHHYTLLGYLNIGCTLLRLNKIQEGVLLLTTYLPKLSEDVGVNNTFVKNTEKTWETLHPESFYKYKSNSA